MISKKTVQVILFVWVIFTYLTHFRWNFQSWFSLMYLLINFDRNLDRLRCGHQYESCRTDATNTDKENRQ